MYPIELLTFQNITFQGYFSVKYISWSWRCKDHYPKPFPKRTPADIYLRIPLLGHYTIWYCDALLLQAIQKQAIRLKGGVGDFTARMWQYLFPIDLAFLEIGFLTE